MHSEWPQHEIDHINGNRKDNRITNLRDITHTNNNCNSKPRSAHGLKGITQRRKKWVAQVRRNSENHYLGIFDTPEEAHAAYCKAALELHGEFANFGNAA